MLWSSHREYKHMFNFYVVCYIRYTLVTPCRYSYDYGMVHMVMLSTEHDYRPGSPQYQWLENDLKSVDRSKTPFVMVGGHRPMYCSEESPGTLDIFFMMSSHSVQNTNTFAASSFICLKATKTYYRSEIF